MKSKLFLVAAAAVFVGVLFSCGDIAETGDSSKSVAESGKAYVSLAVNQNVARNTITPTQLAEDDVTKIELLIKDADGNDYKFADGSTGKEWKTVTETITADDGSETKKVTTSFEAMNADNSFEINIGEYTFTLNLYTTDTAFGERITQTATLTKKIVGGANTLSFETKYVETGNLALTFVIPCDSEGQGKIGKIEAGLFTVASNGKTAFTATIDGKTVDYGFDGFEDFWADQGFDTEHLYTGEDEYANYGTYTIPNLPNGAYYIKIRLYDVDKDLPPLNTITDLVKINGYKTEKIIAIGLDNVNQLFEVWFNLEDGAWKNDATAEKYTDYERNAYTLFTLPTADEVTRTGYVFEGWQDSVSGELITKIGAGKDTARQYSLTAKWEPITYTVAFDKDGDDVEGEMETVSATYDKSLMLPTNQFTRTGYSFGGWALEKGATAAKYADNAEVSNLTADDGATVTLYAIWNEHGTHSIVYTFVDDLENKNPSSFKETETITLTTVSKSGYTFGGWYESVKEEDGVTVVTGDPITGWAAGEKTANVTLYAKWTADGYSITYSGVEGATNPNTVTSYTIETETITLSDATKPGYTFGGWYTTVAGETTETKVTEITKGTTGDITLTAKWTANTDTKYTVKYLQQNIDDDDYTEVKEDRTELTGTTGEMTKATLKSYEGFYSRVLEEAIEQKEISGDGSTVIKIFYDRQTIINYYMIPTLGATASNIIEREGRYGATIEAVTAPTNEGYTFKEWVWRDENEETHTIDNLPTTFDVEDKTFVAVYTKDETSAGVTVTLESITSDDEGIVSLKVEETAIKATVASGYSVYTWRIDDENYEFEDLTLDFSKVTLESEVQPAAVSGAHNIMLIVVNNNDESDYYSATVVFTVTKE